MPGRFGRVLTAMATPFSQDGNLDVDGAQRLARHLLDNGTDTLVVAGTTGESPTLTTDEKARLWTAVVEAAGDGGRVMAGTSTYSTAESVELTRLAEKAGAGSLLLVTPYYNKPPQRGLLEHFTVVAGATGLPVMLYNIPGRTAVRIEHDTLLRLAAVENILAVKDSTGDFDAVSHLIAAAPPDFEVYCGDDWANFGFMCLGAVGAVSVASHVAGERIRQMIDLATSGDVAAARKVHQELLPVFDGMFITSNPIPVKAALELVGQPVGPPRLPLVEAGEEEIQKVRKALEDAGVL